jgi:hypothetical protein
MPRRGVRASSPLRRMTPSNGSGFFLPFLVAAGRRASRRAAAAATGAAATRRRLRAASAHGTAEPAGAKSAFLRTAPRANDAAVQVHRERTLFGALTGLVMRSFRLGPSMTNNRRHELLERDWVWRYDYDFASR